jgi:hypothetical protein
MQPSMRVRRLLALVARIGYGTRWMDIARAAEPLALRLPQSADFLAPEAAIEIER